MLTLNNPRALRYMNISYSGLNRAQTEELLATAYEALNILSRPEVTFMKDEYNQKLLAEENVLAQVSKVFSAIAIIISVFRLITYFNFLVNKEKKKLSIRKVLGAKLTNNIRYMVKPQLLNLLLTSVIVMPVSYFLLTSWKSQFIYQLDLSLWHVFLPIFSVLIIILMIISVFSIKVNHEDPIPNLQQ